VKAAWLLTDKTQREAALKNAYNAFRGTWKTAKSTLNTARKDAWKTFKNETKSCKIPGSQSENSMEGTDNQL
jgi:hypothetical protein